MLRIPYSFLPGFFDFERNQCWPLKVATGEASVVVTVVKDLPAFTLLASNVRLGRFVLGVERVELLIESFLCGLSSVDRATNGLRAGWGFVANAFHPSRKNRSPSEITSVPRTVKMPGKQISVDFSLDFFL